MVDSIIITQGTSVMNVAHWAQAIRSGRFQRFDYGRASNRIRYQSDRPPVYDLSLIPTDLKKLLFVGLNDELADMQDVAYLVGQLGGVNVDVKELPDYNHMDYLWDPEAAKEVYPILLQFIASESFQDRSESPRLIENRHQITNRF